MPYVYQTNYEARMLEPELVTRAMAGRVGLQIMPPRNVNQSRVRWRQRDNYTGLQNMRGLDGRPTLVSRVGAKEYEYTPGYFGEYQEFTETELTDRAAGFDTRTVPIDISDLVSEADDILIGRELDRMESSVWAVLITGTISIKIAGPNGQQTGWSATFAIQTFTASVAWATLATSTPLKDFQAIGQLGVGKGVNFGTGAVAYMNGVTANNMLNNQNANDLSGRRAEFGSTLDNIPEVNRFLAGRNLPQIQVYDEGYIPEGGAFTKFIPDNKVSVIGQRNSGAQIGNYVLTRNLVNPGGAPGSYRVLKDFFAGVNAPKEIPGHIEVHRGHNGGPTIEYPSAVVLMNV